MGSTRTLARSFRDQNLAVGRVGALAVAVGIGIAIASIPAIARADATDSHGSRASNTSQSSAAKGPHARSRPAPSGAASTPSLPTKIKPQSRIRGFVDNKATGGPAAPAVTPLGWTAAAVTRRELAANNFAAHANRVWLFGNGTAEHPNGGLLVGSGFSWDADSCTNGMACRGGNSGLLAGNGGDGFNGGDGGSAGWFGDGGDGGDGIPGGEGGDGGTGGLILGNGGKGGAGGSAPTPGGAGGGGGRGGDAGALSLFGAGGDGGDGGDGGSGGAGGSGGSGGNGSLLWGSGGDGGDGGDGGSGGAGGPAGNGGVPGAAGAARILFVFSRNGAAGNGGATGLDNSLVYFIDDTSQTVNTPTDYGVIGEFTTADRGTLTAGGRVVGESVALINNDGTDGYSLWPAIADLFTSSEPVPEDQKLALAQNILSKVMANPAPPSPLTEFPSAAEGTPTAKGGYVFWAQDFEFNPGHAPTDEVYAGVLAVMWAGKQILGDSMLILPVPSSSIFKTLGSATAGAYNADDIINGDGTTPYLTSLGLKSLPTNPAPDSGGEWNFLSLAYANGLIDGFIGQQYNSNSTGTVTADTMSFYSADLPYALMSSYQDPSQVATGGPWNTDYYGSIPFHAGVWWEADVDPNWGQPPATNQQLIPTQAPLPT